MAVNRIRDHTIIVLDTNAFFIPFKFKINLDIELKRLFGMYQIIVPTCVKLELEKIANSQKFGNMALELANTKINPDWYLDFESKLRENQKIKRSFDDDNPIDDEILKIAKELNGIILTNDKEFLKKLKAKNIQSISLRSKKYLKLNPLHN
jgi:rRNA-processing protein FCF1